MKPFDLALTLQPKRAGVSDNHIAAQLGKAEDAVGVQRSRAMEGTGEIACRIDKNDPKAPTHPHIPKLTCIVFLRSSQYQRSIDSFSSQD